MNAEAKGLSEGVLAFRRWWVGEEGGESDSSESKESGSNVLRSMVVFARS